MKVVLAGYNVESEVVKEIAGKGISVTPEVISAAYARISRDPRSIGTLRAEARLDVEKARQSNAKIVFGFGHHSIAEHAVFNFDIMQLSRLAVEELESFRLASFTEKSQRYIRLGKDIVVPDEFKGKTYEGEFMRLVSNLHSAYKKLYKRMKDSGEVTSTAKEDARYLMPMATSAQLGMTVNARELEYMISRLASHPLQELRLLSKKLVEAVRETAPSLIRYTESTEYFSRIPEIRNEIADFSPEEYVNVTGSNEAVRLLQFTPDGDTKLVASLIFSSGNKTYEQSAGLASRMSASEKREVVRKTMLYMEKHDGVWREFESIHILYELVVSASCYAQIKRHRMATLLKQRYDPSLGISIPDSIRRTGAVSLLREEISRAEKLYGRVIAENVEAAAYILTNAHRRRLLMGLNMRELYHLSRLRSDREAQWEIREVSDRMCELASKELPVASQMLCGKDAFENEKARRIPIV